MKRVIFLFVMLVSGLLGYGQVTIDTAGIVKPKVSVKVNKVYDENGNIVRYDSTYVWSYSNGTKIGSEINADSLFNEFKPWFDDKAFISVDPFNKDFFSDSTMYLDFFNNDKFFEQWQDELFDFNRQINQMDSLKKLFFKNYLLKNEE